MADQIVQKIISAYVDIEGLTSDECKSLSLNEKQADALSEAFADGFISEDERGKLTSVGFSSQLITDLNSSNALQQRVKWLAEIGLKDRDPDGGVHFNAADALVEIGSGAVPALIAALKDSNQEVRSCAAWALGKIGPAAKDAVPALIAALKDQDWEVRYSSAKALRKIGPKATEYGDLFNAAFKNADIDAAEKSIGSRGAFLLWQKFGIERFNRYHPSILKHLVKMASDVNHDRHKPLVLALVASYDDSDVFYWGRRFKYDPRIRLVVIEANNRIDFKDLAWQMRNTYGIPDVVLMTAHGLWDRIRIGNIDRPIRWLKNGDLAEDFKGFFGDKKGQVVINACDAGAPPPKGKKNFAQMAANGFDAETIAARAVEGLLDLRVEITDKGQARLVPTYFEVGADFFGINHGGMKFYPHQEPVHERVADVNNSWQPGIALNIADKEWHVGTSFGYTHQLFNRLRFRYDLLTDVGMNDHIGSRILFSPEIAVGLSNHMMFATGLMGGVEFDLDDSEQVLIQPVIQQYSAFKLVLPAANTEFDFGYVNTVDFENGIRPSFFSRLQGRFDILE
ncbi:MAG: HEAT repeat domain-containing protein [Pseudomonadota bacterium]